MRPKSPQPHHFHGAVQSHFGQSYNMQGNRKSEPYFCDRTLVQSLVKDALVTNGLDSNETSAFSNSGKNQENR